MNNDETLAALGGSGLQVDDNGHIHDWQSIPAERARPLQDTDTNGGNYTAARHAFTADDDDLLRLWCTAAAAEGIRGNRVFEQFAALYPSHTWQSYANRWRKVLQSMPPPILSTSAPFPNIGALDRTESEHGEPTDDNDNSVQPHTESSVPTASEDEQNPETYSDQRVDIDRVLFRKLRVKTEEELEHLISSHPVLHAYSELVQDSLRTPLARTFVPPESSVVEDDEWTADEGEGGVAHGRSEIDRGHDGTFDREQEEVELARAGSRLNDSRSQHQWKVDRAILTLSLPTASSRYTANCPNKTYWTEDDHDIRFIVQVVHLGRAPDEAWRDVPLPQRWQASCDRALWLLLWFKWLHKTTRGKGRDMQRLQRKREKWLDYMSAQCAVAFQRAQQRTTGTVQRPQIDANQHLYLISEEARAFYLRHRDRRLGSWGVGPNHSGTCVLVPLAWATALPSSLVNDTNAWFVNETKQTRLSLSFGTFNFFWARATAWFEKWPREVTELQYFVPPNTARDGTSKFHGSHLCHHGLCIVPSHVVYESSGVNLSRNPCTDAARGLRQYGRSIPKHCNKHDPPCLLQLAALTSFETLAIQFSVLRVAYDLPAKEPLVKPLHHPKQYATFEQHFVLSDAFPDIGVQPADIVRLSLKHSQMMPHGFHWTCPFCFHVKAWSHITNFWAHVRVIHSDLPPERTLDEVRRSAAANQAWAHEHFYNYRSRNPATWQKLVQAQSPDFDMDIFMGWRLGKDKLYKGRSQ